MLKFMMLKLRRLVLISIYGTLEANSVKQAFFQFQSDCFDRITSDKIKMTMHLLRHIKFLTAEGPRYIKQVSFKLAVRASFCTLSSGSHAATTENNVTKNFASELPNVDHNVTMPSQLLLATICQKGYNINTRKFTLDSFSKSNNRVSKI